ncbi:MAG: hypothetical protein A07HR60_00472 [uncultured archaeon A07HR60]|nr:MAG: hypothetical protein A07HR60_00472 [uncultured archaeon A07HR60]
MTRDNTGLDEAEPIETEWLRVVVSSGGRL